jgi:predicted transcriptional regulator of viral defense system
MALQDSKKATTDTALILYAEQSAAEIRAIQRLVKSGQLKRIAPGMVSSSPPQDWPALIARERLRVLAALFAGAVLGYRSAFNGGLPESDTIHLIGSDLAPVVRTP